MTKFLRHLIVYVHTLRHGSSKSEMQQKMNWSRPKSKLSNRILLSWQTIGILAKKNSNNSHVYLHMIDPEFSLQLSDMIWFVIKKKIYTNSDHFKVFLAVLITECLRWVWWEKKYSMILEMHFWLCTFIFLKVKWVAKYMIQEVLK